MTSRNPVMRHKPECELNRGEFIVYPESNLTLSRLLAIAQGRLAPGRITDQTWTTSRRRTRCTCGVEKGAADDRR